MTGTLTRLDVHTGIITGDDGLDYHFYRNALDSFGPKFEDLSWGMTLTFTPISGPASGRWKDHPRAIEVRVRSI